MPQLTVTTTPTALAGKAGRKQLFLRITTSSGAVRFGWREDVSFSTAETQGMLFNEADGIMALGGPDLDLSGTLYFIAASGTVDLDWEDKA